MSIKVMTMVWERPDLDPYECLMMLSLADHADDEGVCFPSIARLCARTGMKERGAQTVLKRLAEKGHLRVEMNAGRKGTNRYIITLDPAPDAPRIKCAPAPDAPITPASDAGASDAPPHSTAKTPAPDAPEPSRTVIGGGGSASARDDHDAILIAAGIDPTKDISGKWYGSTQRWIVSRWFGDLGISLEEAVAVLTETRPANVAVGSLAYFDQAMQRFAGQKAAAPLSPTTPADARASPAPRGLNAEQFDAAFSAAFASRK